MACLKHWPMAHFILQRKQRIGIARSAEAYDRP
jgi:hypothetical protein